MDSLSIGRGHPDKIGTVPLRLLNWQTLALKLAALAMILGGIASLAQS